jgi:hypothetical protein
MFNFFIDVCFKYLLTGLYNVCGAWRSVRLEAAKATIIFFVPN